MDEDTRTDAEIWRDLASIVTTAHQQSDRLISDNERMREDLVKLLDLLDRVPQDHQPAGTCLWVGRVKKRLIRGVYY